MRVRAFAKINLSLRVLGTRPDGYHEVRTVLQSIALHDTLTIRRARGPFVLRCDDPECPEDDTNLVWRAAQSVWRAAGKRGAPRGVAVHLAKRIPMRAGLGGGSSDAAATIRALGRLWRVDEARQREIAASLGADVPFFFEGGTVLGLERGQLLYPLLDATPAHVVLAIPSFGVSTKDAYRWLDTNRRRAPRPVAGRTPGPAASARRTNDLEQPVARRYPEIARLVSTLRRAGARQAAMSGSGSAVFGLFSSRTAASSALGLLAARSRSRCRAHLTRTLDRRSYQRLAGN